jgi:hypothetical protein
MTVIFLRRYAAASLFLSHTIIDPLTLSDGLLIQTAFMAVQSMLSLLLSVAKFVTTSVYRVFGPLEGSKTTLFEMPSTLIGNQASPRMWAPGMAFSIHLGLSRVL